MSRFSDELYNIGLHGEILPNAYIIPLTQISNSFWVAA